MVCSAVLVRFVFVWLVVCVVGFAQTPGSGGGTVGITGKWTYEQAGRNGSRQFTMSLKQEGSKLTGSVPGMGRGGTDAPVEITDGKVEGDRISFSVKREFNGNMMMTKYDGTVKGDELKLKITRETQNGPQTTDVTAKRNGSN